jgi:hypothetical protein
LILEKKSPGRKRNSKTQHTSHKQGQVAPSTVGDLDVLRIRKAEKVILSEEAIQGQYLRDANGRLVPAWQAERERFSTDVATDDNRPLSQQARVPDSNMAPFADTSGFGSNPMNAAEQRDFLTSKDDSDTKVRKNSNAEELFFFLTRTHFATAQIKEEGQEGSFVRSPTRSFQGE